MVSSSLLWVLSLVQLDSLYVKIDDDDKEAEVEASFSPGLEELEM